MGATLSTARNSRRESGSHQRVADEWREGGFEKLLEKEIWCERSARGSIKNLLMPLFLMGCFPEDFQEGERPSRHSSESVKPRFSKCRFSAELE